MLETDCVKYSRAIQKVDFDQVTQSKVQIEEVMVGKKHAYARSLNGEIFFWGWNRLGLAHSKVQK